MLSLFESFPQLQKKLGPIQLGDFPTPVVQLKHLGPQLGISHLYLKHDGLTSGLYGGNKVRKLEFLLARARKKRAREIFTFGFAGSNHAAATAYWARRLGMNPVSLLLPQPNADYVRQNLLVQLAAETEFILASGPLVSTIKDIVKRRAKKGRRPYVVAPGGSSPLGTVGYVNAAFEMEQQLREGKVPHLDRIYVPLGSMGTAVGLILGLKAAGVDSKVVCVRVVDGTFVNPVTLLALFNSTRNFLRLNDPSFPNVRLSVDEIDIRQDFFGEGYARFTEDGIIAAKMMDEFERIRLDGTYTGKTLACLCRDAKTGTIGGENIMFWNTYNSADLQNHTVGLDYGNLPKGLQSYFEEDVQGFC